MAHIPKDFLKTSPNFANYLKTEKDLKWSWSNNVDIFQI